MRSNLFQFMPFTPTPDRPVKPNLFLRLLNIDEEKSNLHCFMALMKENKEARPVRNIFT